MGNKIPQKKIKFIAALSSIQNLQDLELLSISYAKEVE